MGPINCAPNPYSARRRKQEQYIQYKYKLFKKAGGRLALSLYVLLYIAGFRACPCTFVLGSDY